MNALLVILPGGTLWLAIFVAILVTGRRHAPRHFQAPAGAGGVPELQCQSSTRSRWGRHVTAKVGTGATLLEIA